MPPHHRYHHHHHHHCHHRRHRFGPNGLSSDIHALEHIAEFGIILFLFQMGLQYVDTTTMREIAPTGVFGDQSIDRCSSTSTSRHPPPQCCPAAAASKIAAVAVATATTTITMPPHEQQEYGKWEYQQRPRLIQSQHQSQGPHRLGTHCQPPRSQRTRHIIVAFGDCAGRIPPVLLNHLMEIESDRSALLLASI
jgi:hypothetical protein